MESSTWARQVITTLQRGKMAKSAFQPVFKQVLRNPVHLLATGLGSGLIRPAPGTWGSLAAVLLYVLFLQHLPLLAFVLVIVAVSVAGFWICGRTATDWGVHDHGSIVLDEWAGQWIALILVPATPFAWLMAFAYFRLFDVAKPGPIGWADRHFDGGAGIMLDDLLAGAAALASVHLTLWGWAVVAAA